MKPLIWDFGQLNSQTEELYAQQIITRYVSVNALYKRTIVFANYVQ